MPSIYDMTIPAQRWALPQDDKWDTYYDKFEMWLYGEYCDKTQSIRGWHLTWEEACESEFLLDAFIEEYTDRSP